MNPTAFLLITIFKTSLEVPSVILQMFLCWDNEERHSGKETTFAKGIKLKYHLQKWWWSSKFSLDPVHWPCLLNEKQSMAKSCIMAVCFLYFGKTYHSITLFNKLTLWKQPQFACSASCKAGKRMCDSKKTKQQHSPFTFNLLQGVFRRCISSPCLLLQNWGIS